MINFLGFTPDIDPQTPGAITDCTNLVPGMKGMEAGKSLVDEGLGTLTEAAKGFAVVKKLDNSNEVYVGISTDIYTRSGASWASVGSGYSVGADSRWRFAMFGNNVLATSKETIIQVRTTGNFAAVDAAAPKAAVIEVINNQVFAGNTNEASYGDDETRWWFSAIGDHTDWTPAISTGCVTGQFLDSPGPITAARRLGDLMVAYKEKSIFIGQYVGGSQIWNWVHIAGNIGAASHEAVVTTGTAHYFLGPDDFYVFDGSRPVRMNSPLIQWYKDNADPLYVTKLVSVYDSMNGRIYWWFVGKTGLGMINRGICYHIQTNKWGRFDQDIEAAAEYLEAGTTYDGLGTDYTTWDDLPTTISYNSPFWSADNPVLAVIKTDHITYTVSGISGNSDLTTGYLGEEDNFSTLVNVRPRFVHSPTTTTMVNYYSNVQPDNFTTGTTNTYNQITGKYDVIKDARWHKFKFNFIGDTTISGFDTNMVSGGV